MDRNPAEAHRFVALLRAINVGGHTVKMDRLRSLFGALGFSDVATFIASGNVIFASREGDAEALERRIEEHLARELGYPVATFLRTPAELAGVAACRPFPYVEPEEMEGYTLSVAFLKAPLSPEARDRLLGLRGDLNDFHARGREVYWLCRTRTSDSDFSGAVLERTLGMPATLRNITTVRRLAAKYPAPV